MPAIERFRRYRVYLTLLVGISQFILMILGFTNRLAYSVPSRYPLLLQTLDNQLWTILHGVCFIAIVVALYRRKGYITALGAATGVMGAWAFLSLLWGLSTSIPVSLVGPLLAGAMTVLSYMLTTSWARTPTTHNGVA